MAPGLRMVKDESINCSLNEPEVRMVLERLHSEARRQERVGSGIARRIPNGVDLLLRRQIGVEKHARRRKDLYLSISQEQGIFAYLVARSINAHRIIEFGTSFGVSTVYLAAAIKDNGGGMVIGSEIEESKALKAQSHLDEARLAAYVDIRLGDAQETLASPGGTVDMALLDGWKPLYLSILQVLTPHLRPGAVVLADNVTHFRRVLAPYIAHVQDAENGFRSITLPFAGGFEYSVRLGAVEPQRHRVTTVKEHRR